MIYNSNFQNLAEGEENQSVIVPDLLIDTTTTIKPGDTFTRTGYRFESWNTQADGTGTNYLPGDEYTVNGTDVLYARWTPLTAKIQFNENGGTTVEDINSLTGLPLGGEMPTTTRTGYKFLGWFDASGQKVESLPETMPDGTTVYTARWELDFSNVRLAGLDRVYNGRSTEVKATGTLPGDKVEYSVGGGSWTSTAPVFKDVVETNVQVRVQRDGNDWWSPKDDADVTITPATVTVTVDDAVKVYGDDDPTFTYRKGQGVGSEQPVVTGSLSRAAGETAGLAYRISNVGEDPLRLVDHHESGFKASNYELYVVPGRLTIRPQSFVPGSRDYAGINVSQPEDVTYNGFEQRMPVTVTDRDGNPLPADAYSVSYSPDLVNAGNVLITISGRDPNFSGTVYRSYRINRATAVVSTLSATKVYDGLPLVRQDGATITGLVNGETAEVNATGFRTLIGSSTNTYEVVWNGTADADNYNVVDGTLGTLTVTAVPGTPVTPGPTGTGLALFVPPTAAETVAAAGGPAAEAAAAAAGATEETIPEEETPLAAAPEEIGDEETPLANLIDAECWVHGWMFAGIAATVVYGAVLAFRRQREALALADIEKRLVGTNVVTAETPEKASE